MSKVALVFVAMAVQLGRIIGQQSTGNEESGMIMTTLPTGRESDPHIRSLNVIPYNDSHGGTMHDMSYSTPYNFISVDVDYRTNTLYLYDHRYSSIMVGYNYNIELDIANITLELIREGVSKTLCEVAYNWISHVLYWTDRSYNWIVAAPGQKALIPEKWYKIIVHEHLTSPDGLAVDPMEGLLFWTDTSSNAKIERANLDGNNRITLIDTGLITPIALEVDHTSNTIFWVDQYKKTIESANYDGTGRRIVKRMHTSRMYNIAVFKDVIMVSDTQRAAGLVHVLNKTNGDTITHIDFSSYGYEERVYGLGIYNKEDQPIEQDYCLEVHCEQMCIPTKDSAKCTCFDGFKLNQNGYTCDNDTGSYHRAIVLSTDTAICLGGIQAITVYLHDNHVTCIFSLLSNVVTPPQTSTSTRATTTTPPTTTIRPIDTIKMFDINMADRMIYFATTYTIYSRAVDLSIDDSYKELIVAHTKPITGLVYDWIDPNNLYWCDSGAIYVTNVLRMLTEIVVSSPGTGIKEVILLPHVRKLAWFSGMPNRYEVNTAYIDGTGEIQTIAEGLVDPVGLTRDQDNKRIYMIDEDTIKSVEYNETSLPMKLKDATGIDLFLFKNYAVIMSTSGNTSLFETYNRRRSLRLVRTVRFDEGLVFNDVKFLDETLQPDEPSPCHYNNGGCEQICSSRFDGGEKATLKCACTLGYSVDSASPANCITAGVTDMFMLVTDWTYDRIYQIDLLTNVIHAVPIDVTGTPTGVIYNHQTNKIVFGEMYDTFVHQANLDGSETEILLAIESFTFPNRMDFDETTGNIYYTGNMNTHVGIITPRRTYIETLNTTSGFLGDIVLHPGHGRLYFSVENSHSYIAMANMDGTSGVTIIQDGSRSVNLVWPEGLAIDFKASKLYWSDSFHDTISVSELDGTQPTLFLTAEEAMLKDIVVDGTYLYYLAWSRAYITKVLLTNPKITLKIGQNLEWGRMDTMFIYQSNFPNKQPVNPHCAENNGLGNCSTVCLPTFQGRTCACDDNVELKADKRTCADVYVCEITTSNALFADTCNRWEDYLCDYICHDDYEPTGNNVAVKCTSDGWDRRNETLCKEIPKCPNTLDNGDLSAGCTRRHGSTCGVTCKNGYAAETNDAFCLNTGAWYPTPICSDIVCKSKEVKHGSLTTTCTGTAHQMCSYSCEERYVNKQNTPNVKCGNDGAWSPDLDYICFDLLCPASVSYGTLQDCEDRRIGSVCTFACKDGKRNNGFAHVFCNNTGEWHTGMDPCTGPSPVVEAQSGVNEDVLVVGVVVLGIVIVGIIVLLLIIRRMQRRGQSAEFVTYSNDKDSGPSVAITNPGPSEATRNQMQPFSFTDLRSTGPSVDADSGYINPVYEVKKTSGEKHLPELDTTADNVMLTKDSWRKF